MHGATQRYLFEILLNQTEIRLYLPFSDWFWTKRTSVWFQINRKIVSTIWFRFDLIRFGKDFSVSVYKPLNDLLHLFLTILTQKKKIVKIYHSKFNWNLLPDFERKATSYEYWLGLKVIHSVLSARIFIKDLNKTRLKIDGFI